MIGSFTSQQLFSESSQIRHLSLHVRFNKKLHHSKVRSVPGILPLAPGPSTAHTYDTHPLPLSRVFPKRNLSKTFATDGVRRPRAVTVAYHPIPCPTEAYHLQGTGIYDRVTVVRWRRDTICTEIRPGLEPLLDRQPMHLQFFDRWKWVSSWHDEHRNLKSLYLRFTSR